MKPLYLLLMAVTLGATGQISLKYGMNRFGAVEGFSLKVLGALTSPYVLFGFFCYACSSVLWLMVISQVKLSWAYPMLASSYVLIVFLSWLVLKESVSRPQLLALALIVIGVGLLSQTENKATPKAQQITQPGLEQPAPD